MKNRIRIVATYLFVVLFISFCNNIVFSQPLVLEFNIGSGGIINKAAVEAVLKREGLNRNSNTEYIANISTIPIVGEIAFADCKGLVKVVFTDDVVTSINKKAFQNCPKLAEATLPASLSLLDDSAFYQCMNLETVTFSQSPNLTRIHKHVFSECTSLATVQWNNAITQIDTCAFENCSSLVTPLLPSSLTTIEYKAFHGCTSLSLASLPDNLTTIGCEAFWHCYALDLSELPTNLQFIDDNAFGSCNNLAIKELPDNMTDIGRSAFAGCHKIEVSSFPSNMDTIRGATFLQCLGIDTFTLHSGIKYIGDNSFTESNLKVMISLCDTPPVLYSIPFNKTPRDDPQFEKILYVKTQAIADLYSNDRAWSFYFPDIRVLPDDDISVTVSSNDNNKGAVTPTGVNIVAAGVTITVTAEPVGCYWFQHWEDDKGNIISTKKNFEYSPLEDSSITAVFR